MNEDAAVPVDPLISIGILADPAEMLIESVSPTLYSALSNVISRDEGHKAFLQSLEQEAEVSPDSQIPLPHNEGQL